MPERYWVKLRDDDTWHSIDSGPPWRLTEHLTCGRQVGAPDVDPRIAVIAFSTLKPRAGHALCAACESAEVN